ncbi:type 1 glutamine amidotransferase [Rhodococcus sp. NPDC057135]|uniref:type 1 glutamine amidotransferase n=1 Tax=Rhodococcus sp. NPDC057135 TaxID=3346028 RepID=UPI00362A1297
MHFLELRHAQCEPPAAYSPVLESYGDVQTVLLGTDPLPAHRRFDAVIVMGGPMGVGDQAEVEWLASEIEYIRDLVENDVPVWGVCLGSQLLAAALGARVYTGAVPEVGVEDITLTAEGHEDPVWGGLPSTFPAMQWHSDTFDIPDGAVRLAGSAKYPNQLFRYKQSYAVQFHLEASSAVAREWMELAEYRDSLHASLGVDGPRIFMEQLGAAESQGLETATTVMEKWLKSISTK